jgi:hypothetical protein
MLNAQCSMKKVQAEQSESPASVELAKLLAETFIG